MGNKRRRITIHIQVTKAAATIFLSGNFVFGLTHRLQLKQYLSVVKLSSSETPSTHCQTFYAHMHVDEE